MVRRQNSRETALGVLLLTVVSGCGVGGSGVAAESAPGRAVAATTPPQRAATVTEGTAVQLVREIAEERGWPPPEPVPVVYATLADFGEWIRMDLVSHRPPTKSADPNLVWVLLGLVEASMMDEGPMARVVAPALDAVYLTSRRVVIVRAGLGHERSLAAVEHELVHAIQDQRYDLARRTEMRPDGGDEISAVQTLAEGEALTIGMDRMLRTSGRSWKGIDLEEMIGRLDGGVVEGELSPFLRCSLLAPYVDGVRFVARVREREGWAGVEAMWSRPHLSTSELLHWELSERTKDADGIAEMPSGPDSSWSLVWHDVLGEQGLRVMLEREMGRERAGIVAAERKADRVGLFQREGESRAALVVEVGDATLGGGMANALGRALGQATANGHDPVSACRWRKGEYDLVVCTKRDRVAVVTGDWRGRDATAVTQGSCPELQDWCVRLAGRD